MGRRVPISQSTFQRGFSDSINPFLAAPDTWAAGSFGIGLYGESLVRPWKGLYSQGSGSGSNYATQFGSDWGGLQNYSSVSGQGSLLLDYSNTLFTIGAGKASKHGTKLQKLTGTFTFVGADVNTTTGVITEAAHGLLTGQVIYITTSATMPLGLVTTTPYWVIKITNDTFKVAASYINSQVPTPITGGTDGGASTMTVHYGVDITASTLLQVGSVQVAQYFYTYLDEAGLDQSDAAVVTVATTPSASYTGLINGAVNFKIAAIRDRENQGANIDNPNAPVKGRASSATAVVVPNNKTVKITFPTAQSGQTHWAVFSTKEGFGGTGDFYRLGYRTSSDSNATWYFGIAETTVAAATGRILEFDYRTGDLLPEEAWTEDYPPQAGTHCVRLENVMVVLGAFDGTVGQVSLPNLAESCNPFHLIYFPEPVTAVLHRTVDNYAIVACRNSIHALEYVGYRGGDLPSATIRTLTPEIGIAYQENWALGGGMICMFVEGVGLVLMNSDGSIDFEFGREVNSFTKDWTAAATVLCFNPLTRSFVAGNGDSSVSFCLETGTWTTGMYNSDAGVTGTWVSGTNANGQCITTLTNAGTQTAYVFDDNTNTTRMPTCAISQWQAASLGRSANIYEADIALRQGTNVEPFIVGLHTNLFLPYVRGCSTTASSTTLTAPSSIFTPVYTGMQCCIFGPGVGSLTFTADATLDVLTFSSTAGMVTGQSITLTGTLPTGLSLATTYYVIVAGSTTIQLATTLQNARSATAINFTTNGSGTLTAVINFLMSQLTYIGGTSCTMSVAAQATISGSVYALIGEGFVQGTPFASTQQFSQNIRGFAQQNCRSWAISVYLATDAINGQVMSAMVAGTGSESSVVNTLGATV